MILQLFRDFRKSLWLQAVVIFFLALSVRLTIAIVDHAWIHPDKAEMEREAISLAQKGVLGNPYAVQTGPSAHVNPGYALVLAVIYRVFGTSFLGESIKVVCTCLISSAQYALIPVLGSALGLQWPVGLSAALFGAVFPLNPYVETRGDFENHVSAVLLLLVILWAEGLSRRRWNTEEAVGLGVFCGISALISSVLMPVDLAVLAYIAYRQSRISRGRPTKSLLSLLALFLCLLPWAARNKKQLGSPIFTRSNFGLEFFLANNDRASPLMLNNGELYLCCHPLQNVAEARKVREEGEVDYNGRLFHSGVAWVKAHPARFAELVIQRIWYTWMPVTASRMRDLVFRILTALSVSGLLVIARRRKQAAMLLAIPLIVYPLPFYLIQVHLRYRYPMNFVVLLTAFVAIVAAATHVGRALKREKLRVEEQ